MINSKLIRLLSTFNTGELLRLQDFVDSPYFNKKSVLGDLVKLLRSAYPTFEVEKLSKEAVFKEIFPNQSYDQKKVGYLQSDLTKLVLQFLKLEKQISQHDLSLASVLANRKLDKLYKKEIESLTAYEKKGESKGALRYKFKFELYDLKDAHFIRTNQKKDDENAHLASINLDLYYVCRKLQYFVVLLNRKQTLGKELELPEFQFILEYTKANFLKNPIVNSYYELIMMQTSEKPLPHFFNLKETIKKHYTTFSSVEIAEIYENAINFCILRISFDQAFYIGEALSLYMEFLDSGHMYQNGFLSHYKFKNIIKLGLLLERFDFVEQFISKYIDKIREKHRNKALHYNLAELQFAKLNFESAQEHLSVLLKEDLELAYTLGSRMILIKIFYQNKEEDALLSQIAAFTIFLKRSKNVSNTKKKIYLNFCDILNKILRQNPKHYHKIENEIKQTKLITDSSWLLKVYHELTPPSLMKNKPIIH